MSTEVSQDSPEILNAAREAALDVDALVARVDKVLGEPIYWFPVRHHSPTIARHIGDCIRERKPKIVFIEGPHEAQEMIEFLIDSKTRPPVAIYSSFRDDSAAGNVAGVLPAGVAPPGGSSAGAMPGVVAPTGGASAGGAPRVAPAGAVPSSPPAGANLPGTAPLPAQPGMLGAAIPRLSVWYPIVSYSPEYVAMSAAKQIGAKSIFIDLPHYAIGEDDDPANGAPLPRLLPSSAVPAPGSPRGANPAAVPMDESPDADAPKPNKRRDLDEIAPLSTFYQLLAKTAGYRSWSETWDGLFELPKPGQTYETIRREVALFCAAIRATTPKGALEIDRTLARERFMWRKIRRTLEELDVKPEETMVVCGGFHIFMDQNDPKPPPEIPLGKLSVTVAPYSYFRISELSGYGAGNRAPRFYELCFEHHSGGLGQDRVVIDYIVDCLKEARRRGELYSSADAISATQQALLLARLRGRSQPVLDDIHDALLTCCCKGNPKTDAANLLESIDEINIGTKLGRVTDRIGRLPIINDFYEQLDRLKLEEVAAREKMQNYALDKRQPLDSARSAFLHRLIFLGVEIGAVQREASPFGQSIFKEHWKLKWSPKIEAGLIERSLHGDTVEAAATTVLSESLGVNTVEAGPACRRLVQAIDMDLPQLVAHAEQATGHAIDHDDRFGSLADALTSLMLLERYAAYRSLGKQRLAELISRCFDRACFAIPEVASVPPEEWDNVIQGLLALAEPVMQRQDLDANLFAAHVDRAARESTMPFLRGAFLGVLTEMRRMKPEAIAAELTAYARGSVEQQIVAGDFLHGVLKVSKTAIMLGATALVAAIDELLRNAEGETFLNMVPRLRGAFETLHERQRDGVALHVAELYGIKEDETFRTLTISVPAAQLMAELDGEVAKIMGKWLAEKV
jgi:hypothetical protein